MASMSLAESPRVAQGAARFLRGALWLDVVVSGANALAYLAIPGLLASLLGIDPGLLRGVGVFFVFYVSWVAWVASRQEVRRGAVWSVIALNFLWMVDSLAVAFSGRLGSEGLGTAWVVFQGVAVGGFALLQWIGLRRALASSRGV